MPSIPFSGHYTASLPAQNNKHRLKQIKKFIGTPLNPRTTLDVGAENYIGLGLGITDFTSGDLNRTMRSPKDEYDVVTCFEVINHCFNHGVLLDNISSRLRKEGKLYLSTPHLWGLVVPHGRGNYVEMTPRSMRTLLEYKGFKIIRYESKMSYPFRYVFSGFLQPFRAITGKHFENGINAPKMQWKYFGLRPIIKFLLHRYQIYECQKI